MYIPYFTNLPRIIYTAPHLEKKCVRLSDAVPSHKILDELNTKHDSIKL